MSTRATNMKYLLIENRAKVVPSVEAIRMLGVSFSRGNDSSIGQFGSGAPCSLALLARTPNENGDGSLLDGAKLCLGKDVFTWSTVDHVLRDSSGNRQFRSEIRMKKQNGGSWDLNISTEFGALDWTDESMAVREFVSNALDGAEQFDGTYGTFRIEQIEGDPKVCRAKDGYIRMYIPVNYRISQYVQDIEKYFICLKPGYDPNAKVIPNEHGGPARVYRKGVLVGEFGKRSLFDYNINRISLKESRVVDSYEAEYQCACAISTASADVLAEFIKNVNACNPSGLWESSFSVSHVNPAERYSLTSTEKAAAKLRWKEAIDKVMPNDVICESALIQRMVASKGLNAVVPVNSAFGELLKGMGAKSSEQVLNRNEIEGKEIVEPTQNVIRCLYVVWSLMESMGLTGGKSRPGVKCFHQHASVEGMAGYYRPLGDTVYINSEHSEDRGCYLMSIMIEEVSHYITGAHDCTREFQDFAFKAASMAFLRISGY